MFSYDIKYLRDLFISRSSNCRIQEWEVYEADGKTLMQKQDGVSVEFQAGAVSVPLKVSIDTWIQDYTKTIILKNKDINPSGQCNWQCYIDRYPQDALPNWEEAQNNWDTSGKAAGRNCRCDEVAKIKVVFKVAGCEAYGIYRNKELPKEYPQRADYRMDVTGPKLYIHERPSTTGTYTKDLSDRFISEDSKTCPLSDMRIAKVTTYDGEVVSNWEDYIELKTNGTFTVKKMDTPITHWQIFIQQRNSRKWSSEVNQIDLTIAEPYKIDLSKLEKQVQQLEPKVNFIIYRNSTGFTKDKQYQYEIPRAANVEEKINIYQIDGFNPEFMSFDDEK